MAFNDEDFYCDYQLYVNGTFEDESNDPDEIWELLGEYPFGSRYEIRSATGKDTSQFIPF